MLYRIGREYLPRHPHLLAGALGNLARLVPQGVLYGKEFRRRRRFLAESQWWSREQLESYQLTRLKEALEYAHQRIPFFRDAFARHGVTPDALHSLDDIRRFPIMDKEDLVENFDRILAPHLEGEQLMPFCTGGTSGSGIFMLFEEEFRQREQAFIWRMWNTVGYRHGMFAAILQHRECPEDVNDGFWYLDRVSNAIVLSAYKLAPDTVHRYLEALERHRPKVLIAYPSLAHILAVYAEEAGFDRKIFDLILCSSETIYDFQRSVLERVFQAQVRLHYGLIESCALFGYCEHTNRYHVYLEYGHTELLKENGEPAGPGESGEIVATGFENYSMPLVRFRTGDIAQVGEGTCECGRAYPLVERIEGREGDFIRAPSGKTHSPVMVEFLMDGRVGFKDLQIVQTKLEEVTVKVVPGQRFTQEELDYFVSLLEDRLEHEIEVRVEMAEEIPRTRRQKKSLVVSHLPGALGAWRS